MNLLEVSYLDARASQSGAGGTSSTTRDEGLGLDQRGCREGPA